MKYIAIALSALLAATPAFANNGNNGNNGNNNGPTTVHNTNQNVNSANAAAIAAAKAQAKAVAKQQQRQQQRQQQSQSSRNSNRNSSSSNNRNDISIQDRRQAPALGSFGSGGPCPEGLQFSVPGGAAGLQWQCREGKQQMKAGTVGSYFGGKGARDYLCDTDKSLYGLDHCVQRRIKKSGIVQRNSRR